MVICLGFGHGVLKKGRVKLGFGGLNFSVEVVYVGGGRWCWRPGGIDWRKLEQNQFWRLRFCCPRRIVWHLGVGFSMGPRGHGQAYWW